MRSIYSTAVAALLVIPVHARATELEGPARFCGYSPIIDLLPGEKVTTLEGGIHGGNFRWEGAFGSFDIQGIGWASPAKGRMLNQPSTDKLAIFAPRRVKQGYQVAIWNGAHATAYFTSPSPFSAAQMAAIKRVRLFEEGQQPSGCKLQTIFVWE
ncbi:MULTISPECIES: hypothetical protein [unclassified Novosphingobium]|uniref:hypothetical protein n=1 Tax=unclassified Novosphingobium TaxID=2644732 RepID=UPI000869AFEE|nr:MULTISPECIES: hypothetical protein [unclassified Novosphingobium]MDR6707547.1 hypothetical protein [Novosphingobium sp. 1748]ODU79053.1 MAG: hypothetical protein ABT10_21325 [Novosphingobium sp. SCN 63-17]OJX96276.1 MAG: hypothetical protein BGP00_16940 [Novosphingobium sp. 63-713]